MARQTKTVPARLSPRELARLKIDLQNALGVLQDESIPDSLGHMDLNPENVIVLSDRTIFLDWAEASVGHPFFTFAYLLEYFRKTFGENPQGRGLLIAEYARVWESSGAFDNLAETLRESILVAIFAHAVSTDVWRDARKIHESGMAGYYRSLGRRMKAYGDDLESHGVLATETLT